MSTRSVVEKSKHTLASISPLTGELLRAYEQHSDQVIEQKLQLAQETFREYRKVPFTQRAQMMTRASEILDQSKDAFARLMTQEMGKTLRSAVQEAEKCAFGCRFYAENAERFLAREEASTNATRSYVLYQPLGLVLAVMPWNFPFWQVFRFAAPALMAGNVAVLKHASNVPQCALAGEEVFQEAGFPSGVFRTLLVGGSRVDGLISDARIRGVSLTGSDVTGSQVAGSAG